MISAKDFLDRVHEVSEAVAFQAGVGGVETAGFIISCLHTHPEQIERFMTEGTELILDGTIAFANGSLTCFARDGRIISPANARAEMGKMQ